MTTKDRVEEIRKLLEDDSCYPDGISISEQHHKMIQSAKDLLTAYDEADSASGTLAEYNIEITKDIEKLEADNAELREALELSIGLIKQWHNMDEYKLPKEERSKAWKIYYSHAPEMKPIRQAADAVKKGE